MALGRLNEAFGCQKIHLAQFSILPFPALNAIRIHDLQVGEGARQSILRERQVLRESRRTLKLDGSGLVFATHDGKPPLARKVMSMMTRALKGCHGIPDHKQARVTFQITRDTFASRAAYNGISVFEPKQGLVETRKSCRTPSVSCPEEVEI